MNYRSCLFRSSLAFFILTFLKVITADVFYGNPSNYLTLLRGLSAGDTLFLEPGTYNDPNDVPGLPFFGIHGLPGAPIVVAGTDPQNRPCS